MLTKKLIPLTTLVIFCVLLVGCATSKPAIVVERCKDFADGVDACPPPVDKTTWMWITYPTAKAQLHWVNHK